MNSPSVALSLMERIFAEGFATGNADVVDAVCSPDLVEHQFRPSSGDPVHPIEQVKEAIRSLHRAVPDLSFTIEDSVERGDTIWVRVRMRGTASGPFFGPPSNRRLDLTVIDIARVVDGRIVEHWGVPDRFAMLVQTGVLERLTRAGR
jgi:predicted ester cyclase